MTEESYSESYLFDVLKANNRIDFVEAYYERINTFHHYLGDRFLARTFYEAFKNQDRSATTYSAALSSIKATIKALRNSCRLCVVVISNIRL